MWFKVLYRMFRSTKDPSKLAKQQDQAIATSISVSGWPINGALSDPGKLEGLNEYRMVLRDD